MTIPLATTTFAFSRRANAEEDGADEALYSSYVTGVRGVLTFPSGLEALRQGSQTRTDARITCDIPAELPTHVDQVLDETTGEVWAVAYVNQRRGLGLDHLVVGVNRVSGGVR